MSEQNVYDFQVLDGDGNTVSLDDYKGRVLLIVNGASKCGFTPQYEGLETLYKDLHPRGFDVLVFPCNQFGNQEPGSHEQIQNFCNLTFNISFPLFGKIDVNGAETHPLYAFMKAERPGLLGSKAIKWNFTKFLVDREGNVVKRYAPTDTPASIREDITALL